MKNLKEALVNKNNIKYIKTHSKRYIVDPFFEYDDYAFEHYESKRLVSCDVYILTSAEIKKLIKNVDVESYSDIKLYLNIYDFNDDDDILHAIDNSDRIWDDIVDEFKLRKVSPKKFI